VVTTSPHLSPRRSVEGYNAGTLDLLLLPSKNPVVPVLSDSPVPLLTLR
jgi:hypothetical protein